MKAKRLLAYPLAIGAEVPLRGRVKECADLIEPGRRLLDVGCSSGWLAPIVASRGFRDYVGVDRVIVGAAQADRVAKFVQGSVFNLPFQNGSFDAVCLFDVIEHLPRDSERDALSEARRVLQDDGQLYFSTPHASLVHTLLDPAWGLGHRHYRRVTVRRLLESAGLSVKRIFVAGGIVESMDHIRLLTYKHLLHRATPQIHIVDRLTARSHGRDHRLGMTIFAVASPSLKGP
jgi:SAM-dependent methyltransferase